MEFYIATNGSAAAEGEISYGKTDAGTQFDALITANGGTLSINGTEEIKDGKAVGELTVSVPGSDEMSIEYEGTITFGKPSEKVAEDERFEVDTENADITDFSLGGVPGLSGLPAGPDMPFLPFE